MLAEWLFGTVLNILCGKFSEEEFTGWITMYSNIILSYSLSVSLTDTTLTYMGNAMGDRDYKKARVFLKASLSITVVGIIIIELIYGLFARGIISFYLNDPKAIEVGVNLLRLFTLIWPPDCSQMILGAGIRAIGKEKVGSMTVLICFYAIGLPIAIILGLHTDLRVYGLILGEVSGYYCILLTYMFVYWNLNWKELAKTIVKKLRKDQVEAGELIESDLSPSQGNYLPIETNLMPT